MLQSNVRQKRFARLALCVVCLGALSGCGSLNSKNMVPDIDTQWSLQTGKSIRIVAVRGEQESIWGGPLYVQKEQIHAVVVEALTASGFFSSVDTGAGDLNLEVVVRLQSQDAGLFPYTGRMTVTYRFTDTSGEAVWSATLKSSGSSNAISGVTRTIVARERTVKANVTAFINELNKSWGKQ